MDATTKSARRVMEIMEHFRDVQEPLTLKQICESLHYPVSSGQALLKCLVTIGYLDYDRTTRRYMPTMRIAMIADWVPERLFGQTSILPDMRRIGQASGQSVLLGTRSDLSAQYIHVVQPPRHQDYQIAPGTLRPLEGCAIGRLYLSTLDEQELDLTVRRIDIQRTKAAPRIDRRLLSDTLHRIRRDGFAFTTNLVRPGHGALAILLPAGRFHRQLAIGVGGRVAELTGDFDAILSALRDVADSGPNRAQDCLPPSSGYPLLAAGA